jgi:serine/threonine protein kinase/tetratricopeptide (TPR) repeat protein
MKGPSNMICPRCGTENPDAASKCSRCGINVAFGTDDETFAGIVPAPIQPGAGAAAAPAPALQSPSLADMATAGPWAAGASPDKSGNEVSFGPRYKIQRMLGEGGMGAVYKAYDIDLDRHVALKLIRPGLAMDANVAQRFKQELLLASKVSHKNILRIHDLGDANGVKFISMAYVEGQDLYQLLVDNGKLGVERSVNLAKQMASALDAAHAEGVVHRDFKPQNILLDKNEQVYVTDFGLAKSLEADAGLSRSGEFLGTPRYMAPEQVEGKGIDHRVDLYALGLIMYEMLTGDVPFHADSTIQLMYKRVNEKPKSPKELNPDLPDWIVRVVMKCLERNPDDRYQSAADLLTDLQHQLAPAKTPSGTVAFTVRRVELDMPAAKLGLLIAVAIVVIAAAVTFAVPSLRHKVLGTSGKSAYSGKPISVLVADFNNHTGDPVFDGTLEPMVTTAVEGASFINAYSRNDARKLAQKLPHPTDKLDEESARLVAMSQSVTAVVSGEISRRGDSFAVSAIALDALTGNVLAKSEISVSSKDKVLHEIPKLMAPIRNALGDSTPASVQFETSSGAFNASSVEAVHQEAVGVGLQFSGKFEDALKAFTKATELDPNFALAYSGMAAMAGNLGKQQDADRYIKLAMQHEDRMTERERYRTRGLYYARSGNWQKCIEEYTNLVSRYPADRVGQSNIAACYAQMRDLPKAAEAARQAVQIVPKGSLQRLNLSFLESFTGDFAAGERDAREALELSPSSEIGFLAVAESQLGQGQISQAIETYRGMEKIGTLGASMAASGLGDMAIYEGRYKDATKLLTDGAMADLAAKQRENAADKYVALAYAQLLLREKTESVAAADKALANSQSVKIKFLTGLIFAENGEAKAQKMASELSAALEPEPQSYGKVLEGSIALHRGDMRQAIQSLTEANKLLDTWISRFQLGRAYLEAGKFIEADSEFDRCIKRHGETLELFMDNVPTYRYLPLVYYYQGRVREGLKSANFTDSYKTYLGIRSSAGEDPLLAEIRPRLGN